MGFSQTDLIEYTNGQNIFLVMLIKPNPSDLWKLEQTMYFLECWFTNWINKLPRASNFKLVFSKQKLNGFIFSISQCGIVGPLLCYFIPGYTL